MYTYFFLNSQNVSYAWNLLFRPLVLSKRIQIAFSFSVVHFFFFFCCFSSDNLSLFQSPYYINKKDLTGAPGSSLHYIECCRNRTVPVKFVSLRETSIYRFIPVTEHDHFNSQSINYIIFDIICYLAYWTDQIVIIVTKPA